MAVLAEDALDYEGTKIAVFQALNAETLQICKDLKAITMFLHKAGIRYHRRSYFKWQVIHISTIFLAMDPEEGLQLLQELKLEGTLLFLLFNSLMNHFL